MKVTNQLIETPGLNIMWFIMEDHRAYNKELKEKYKLERGWGNGYICIPSSHPWYMESWSTLDYTIGVHGGVTYADFPTPGWLSDGEYIIMTNSITNDQAIRKILRDKLWILGFDTNHADDSIAGWPRHKVIKETIRFALQARQAWIDLLK